MSIAEKHSLALRRVWSYRQRCCHCHTTLAVQMPEDHTIRPSVVLAQWFDCPRAALGDRAATLCEGGDARLCPSQGPRSECLAVPVSLVVILHKQLNFHSFCATISPRKDVFLKESMTMRRMTKKAMALVLHAEGATVEEIAQQLDTRPSYVANVLAAEGQRPAYHDLYVSTQVQSGYTP